MLVLTRKISESIVIADNICVTIINIKGNQVRLGIEAPRTIDVNRKEIYLAKKTKQLFANSNKNKKIN